MEENTIIQGDILEALKTLPSESVDCIITSPPYNKSYYDKRKDGNGSVWKQRKISYGEFSDDMNPEDYDNWQRAILQELVRIIKPTGSIFYNHKSFSFEHSLVFPKFVFDFNVRQMIIWDRGSTPQINPIRFYPITEYIFWITKNKEQPYFDNSTISHKTEIWKINAKPLPDHPAPFPEELVANCILATTKEDDIVLDPFMGSGTTAVVATKLKRKWLGIEINPEYVKYANDRIKSISNPLF